MDEQTCLPRAAIDRIGHATATGDKIVGMKIRGRFRRHNLVSQNICEQFPCWMSFALAQLQVLLKSLVVSLWK